MTRPGSLAQEVPHVTGVPDEIGIALDLTKRTNHRVQRGRLLGGDRPHGAEQRHLGEDVVLQLPGEDRPQDAVGQEPTRVGGGLPGRYPFPFAPVVLPQRLRDDAVWRQCAGRGVEEIDSPGHPSSCGRRQSAVSRPDGSSTVQGTP